MVARRILPGDPGVHRCDCRIFWKFDDFGYLSGSGTGQLCRLPDPGATMFREGERIVPAVPFGERLVPVVGDGVSSAGYFAGGAAGAPGIAGTPAGGAGMPAGGAGIVWTGAAPPLFMMLREPPLPEK